MNCITRMVTVAALGLGATAAFNASADLFYFNGTTQYLPWSDPASWSLESVGGPAADRAPGAADRLYGLQHRYLDLEGATDISIDGITSTGDWSRHNTYMTNGTLTITGQYNTHSDSWYLQDGATLTLAASSTYVASFNHGAADEFYVKNGGALNIFGSYSSYNSKITVYDGGTCTIDATKFGLNAYTGQTTTYKNNGTFNLPNGLVWQEGNVNGTLVLTQSAGTLTLGGPLNKNDQKGTFKVDFTGGIVEVTGDVFFNADEIKVSGKQVDFVVEEGKTLEIGATTYADDAVVTKSGAGCMAFGENMPSQVYLWGGKIAIRGEDATLNGSVSAANACTVEIGAKGFTFASAVYSAVKFAVANGVFEVGDVIMTCADAAVLNGAYNDLTEAGQSVEIVGNTIVKAASSAKFISTTTTDLNDPAGWASGQVPPAGSEVSIEGAGVVADVATALPNFSKITVKDGAELKVSIDTADAFPCVVALVGTSKLTVSGKMNVSQSNYLTTALGEGGEMPVVEVVADGVLTVPGGMNFKDVDFRLTGTGYDAGYATLQTSGDGTLTFGYAAAGETTKIAFTSVFGKVLTPGTRGKCSTRFAYAEEGGTVTVVGEMLSKETEYKRNKDDTTWQNGFNFGHGMDPDVPFRVTFDNCRKVDCLYDTTLEGGAVVTITNNTVIGSTFTSSNNGDKSKVQIHVLDKAKLVLDGESSLQMAITANWEGSYLDLRPSEDGWESLVVRNGSFVYLGRQQGNDKARITVEDGIWECFYTQWWNGDRMQWIFNHAKEVNVPEGKSLTVRLVNYRYGSDQGGRNGYYPMSWTPIVGGGDFIVGNGYETADFRLEMESGANACTGTISVDATKKKNALFFEDGANWAGKVVLDGKVSFGKSVWTDKSKSTEYMTPAKEKSGEPATVSFGEANLAADYTIRLWGKVGFTNDVINVTGAGWTGDGKLLFAIQDGHDVQEADKWLLGSAPKGTALPATTEKWQVVAEDDPDDAAKVNLWLSLMPSTFNFISNKGGSTDLGDPTAWESGKVPVGKEVTILGENVVAEISDDQPLPEFASIAVKGGATLRINADVTNLPPLSVDAVSRVEVKEGAALVLPVSFTCFAKEDEAGAFVSMAKLLVETNATLTVQAGAYLKNVDMEIDGGTVKSLGKGQAAFGYANKGETSYFALRADCATFDMPDGANTGFGTINWLTPAAGGCVKAVGEITFKNTKFPIKSWADYHTQNFCVGNPTDEEIAIVFDNSVLQASLATKIGGSARLAFRNGGYLTRSSLFAGHYGSVEFVENAAVVFEGENSGMSFDTNGGERPGLKLGTAVANRTVVTLKDGAYLNVRRVQSYDGAGIVVENYANLMVDKKNNDDYVLYENTPVAVPEGAVLNVLATAYSSQGSNIDRDCTFLGTFTGAGDVRVTNLNTGKSFRLTLSQANADFAGSIAVLPAEREDSPTTLLFADGAVWAGTVVADANVALTNLTDGAASAAVTFGTLNIPQGKAFGIRVWKNGDTVVSDTVNLTAGAVGGGVLNVVPQGGVELGAKDRFVLGTAPAGAWAGVTIRVAGKRYRVEEEPTAVEGIVTCTARLDTGFILTIH